MQTSTSKSPRTASNGSSSTNGSGHEDSGPPEPKRIKIEPAIVSPSREDSDDAAKTPAEVSSRSVTSPSCPPLVMILHPSPKISEAAILRCESCNIGFSHLSNLMAHKKFYCRGVQPVGAERSNSPWTIRWENPTSICSAILRCKVHVIQDTGYAVYIGSVLPHSLSDFNLRLFHWIEVTHFPLSQVIVKGAFTQSVLGGVIRRILGYVINKKIFFSLKNDHFTPRNTPWCERYLSSQNISLLV